MSTFTKITALFALALTFSVAGCDSDTTGPAAAPAQDELTQYLQDNPDVATAVSSESEDAE